MDNSYIKIQSKNVQLRTWLWLIASCLPIALLIFKGPISSPDTHTYSNWSNLLIHFHMNYLRYIHALSFEVSPTFYAGWISIVAISKILFKSFWREGIVILNLIAFSFSIFGILYLVDYLTKNRLTLFVAFVFILLAHDMYLWVNYVLSDITFMFLAFGLFFQMALTSPNQFKKLHIGKIIFIPILLAFIVLYRPAGLAFLLFLLMALFSKYYFSLLDPKQYLKGIYISTILLLLIAAIILVFYVLLMSSPSSFSNTFMTHLMNAKKFGHYYREGIVVMGRPTTYMLPPHRLIDFFNIVFVRFFYFFAFIVTGFSKVHAYINSLFYIPIYFLCLVAFFHLFVTKEIKNIKCWWVTWLSFLFLFIWAFLTALNFTDFDWRYRLPCMPVFIVLASIGFYQLAQKEFFKKLNFIKH
ncbi:MAG: hypothetical protein JW855_01320 [Gammaproteobacteria bacterium]|nr:hypothetical protein [Gammaproteobacteria bacterium]